ncbi:hypothetical protein, partial [Mycobacterium bourgelatii]
NNGLFWRGDRNGLIGGQFSFTIPEIPITLSGGGILELPITGEITGLTVQPFTVQGPSGGHIPVDIEVNVLGLSTGGLDVEIDLPWPVGSVTIPIPPLPLNIRVDIDDTLTRFQLPAIYFRPITFNNVVLGGPSTPLTVMIGGNAGPVNVDFYLPPMPGFGNS